MKYERFEDLPVWQDAIRLAERCEDFLISAKTHITYSKRDQLDRCSLSVSNNIAEGFERGSTNELLPSSTSPEAPQAKSAPCSASSNAALH